MCFRKGCAFALYNCSGETQSHNLTLQHKSPIMAPIQQSACTHHTLLQLSAQTATYWLQWQHCSPWHLPFPSLKMRHEMDTTIAVLCVRQSMRAKRLWWGEYGNTETQHILCLCLPSDAFAIGCTTCSHLRTSMLDIHAFWVVWHIGNGCNYSLAAAANEYFGLHTLVRCAASTKKLHTNCFTSTRCSPNIDFVVWVTVQSHTSATTSKDKTCVASCTACSKQKY